MVKKKKFNRDTCRREHRRFGGPKHPVRLSAVQNARVFCTHAKLSSLVVRRVSFTKTNNNYSNGSAGARVSREIRGGWDTWDWLIDFWPDARVQPTDPRSRLRQFLTHKKLRFFFFFSFLSDNFYGDFFPISPSPLSVLLGNTAFLWRKKISSGLRFFCVPSTVFHNFFSVFRAAADITPRQQVTRFVRRVLTVQVTSDFFMLTRVQCYVEKYLSLVFFVFILIA